MDLHEHGISRNELKKRLQTTKSGCSLEIGLACLERVYVMIARVRDNKYIAKNVLSVDRLVDLARAPVAYLKKKVDNKK